jgi:glycosyltransferase involved in cell wall biosynthesis
MKIALLTHHFPPNFTAGAEQYAYRIAQSLQQQGHDVPVVCIESVTEGSLTPASSVDRYHDLIVHRLHFDIQQAPDPFEWSFRHPELGKWVQDLMQRERPDIVHINSGYLLSGTVPEAAYELGLPTVLTLHDYWFVCPLITLLRTDGTVCAEPVPPSRCVWCALSQKRRYRLLDQRLSSRLSNLFVALCEWRPWAKLMRAQHQVEQVVERRAYLKQVFQKIDLVVSPSRFAMAKIAEYGLEARRMVHLPFGLDQSQLSATRRNDTTPLRIGYLGQFAPHKGVHLLLDAFQRLNKQCNTCELVLHGRISSETPYERKLLQRAQADPAIRFAGPYANTDVGQVLAPLDVIVVPSVWYENRPTVIVEAHATGTPVVATRLGGMAELIRHNENGLLFEPGSAAGLAEQLQRLIDEPTLLPSLRQGIEPVATVEEETAKLTALYRELLSSRQRAGG